ncbi:MAG: hypothetical protein WAM58_02030 [Candidatus Acidiferrum sp.]
MSRAVKYLDASSHHNIVADGDLTPDRESAIVPDGHVVADSKRGVVGVSNREYETAFAVDGDVVPKDKAPAAHNPVKEWTGMHITPIFGAICLEKRLAEKNSATKVIDLAQEQKQNQDGSKYPSRSGEGKVAKKAVNGSSHASQRMVGDRKTGT